MKHRRVNADDIRQHEFRQARRRQRGLDPDDVHFCQYAWAAEMEQLIRERDAAHDFPAAESAEVEATYARMRAQQDIERLITSGQQQARKVVELAYRQQEQILADGQISSESLAQQTLDRAMRRAADIIASAPAEARTQFERNMQAVRLLKAAMTGLGSTISAAISELERAEAAAQPEQAQEAVL